MNSGRGHSNKRKLHWRIILPVFHTLLYCGLSYFCFQQTHPSHAASTRASSEYELVFVQEGIPFAPKYIEQPHPRACKISWSINFPSVFLASLILIAVDALLPYFSLSNACFLLSGIFVPFFWYYIGRWIDKRQGICLPHLLQTIAVGMGLLLSVLSLHIGLIAFRDTPELFIGAVGWGSWFFWKLFPQINKL